MNNLEMKTSALGVQKDKLSSFQKWGAQRELTANNPVLELEGPLKLT